MKSKKDCQKFEMKPGVRYKTIGLEEVPQGASCISQLQEQRGHHHYFWLKNGVPIQFYVGSSVWATRTRLESKGQLQEELNKLKEQGGLVFEHSRKTNLDSRIQRNQKPDKVSSYSMFANKRQRAEANEANYSPKRRKVEIREGVDVEFCSQLAKYMSHGRFDF